MAEIIEVDFKKKKKLEKYVTKKWTCSTCNDINVYDSRKEDNVKYIQFANRSCVCKNCATAISDTVKDEGW